ncbi:FAD synthetase family protein [Lentibacillus sp. Marseille-P4043]|uniref:FAD synthetase family protein n=1 Tax=Lentibacillus sp. Marseille-P4043 TaxID=2040293 RepID=UPI000D0B034F|nr:FAD synthetase family protein [Lentibacillus sp. Marseille-P4043]
MEVYYVTHPIGQINSDEQVLAIGFFDGVHLGHQQLLNRAKQIAEKKGIVFSAMTFSPHPDEVIKGDKNREYLTPLPQKVEKMAELGVEKLFVVTFNKSFASLPPIDFITNYIRATNTKHVVVGFDFTFGFKAQGDTHFLKKEAKKGEFGLSIIPKQTFHGQKISSTRIRELLSEGNIEMVPYYLGMNYTLKGAIIQQKRAGVLAVQIHDNGMLPKPGKYEVKLSNGKKTINGVFYRNSYTDNRIFVNEPFDCSAKDISIKFLNSISAATTVSS